MSIDLTPWIEPDPLAATAPAIAEILAELPAKIVEHALAVIELRDLIPIGWACALAEHGVISIVCPDASDIGEIERGHSTGQTPAGWRARVWPLEPRWFYCATAADAATHCVETIARSRPTRKAAP